MDAVRKHLAAGLIGSLALSGIAAPASADTCSHCAEDDQPNSLAELADDLDWRSKVVKDLREREREGEPKGRDSSTSGPPKNE